MRKKPDPHSFRTLVNTYQFSPGWDKLATKTQQNYARDISKAMRLWADRDIRTIKLPDIEAAYMQVVDTSGVGAGYTFAAVIKKLFSYATDKLDLLPKNPAKWLEPHSCGTIGFMPEDRFQDVLALLPEWLRRAAWLAGLTAQRVSDIAPLRWSQWNDGRWNITQEKTGVLVSVPVPSDLVPVIDAMRGNAGPDEHVILRDGLPVTANQLSNAFSYHMGQIDPDLDVSMHSLRKMRLTQLAKAGATTYELQSVSGHKSAASLKPYVDMSQRETYSDNAIRKAGAFAAMAV